MENKGFTHTSHIEVRYAETDAMGVVHHGSYPIWFEQARVDFFKAAGVPYTEVEAEGFASPVLELHVQYRRPCKFGDIVDVETTMTRESALKCRFNYRVYIGGELSTTGYTIHAFTKGGIPTREKPQCFKKIEDFVYSER